MTNLINLLLDGNKLEGDIEEVLDGLNDSLGKYMSWILEVHIEQCHFNRLTVFTNATETVQVRANQFTGSIGSWLSSFPRLCKF